jgi:hypothetical protein
VALGQQLTDCFEQFLAYLERNWRSSMDSLGAGVGQGGYTYLVEHQIECYVFNI